MDTFYSWKSHLLQAEDQCLQCLHPRPQPHRSAFLWKSSYPRTCSCPKNAAQESYDSQSKGNRSDKQMKKSQKPKSYKNKNRVNDKTWLYAEDSFLKVIALYVIQSMCIYVILLMFLYGFIQLCFSFVCIFLFFARNAKLKSKPSIL